jgi:periplasmic copper chaperone A
MKRTLTIAIAVALLAVPATAAAHVTLQPNETAAGGFTRLDVRVPNELDNASTTKVEVKFPPGFITVSTEPVSGWTVKVTTSKLAKPQVNDDGEKVTDQIDTITWTGDGQQGAIRPGEFQDFGLSLATPDKPGTSLTFKALQTYSNGKVVRWIGPPDAEEPAPQVKLTSANPAEGGTPASSSGTAKASNASSSSDDDTGAPTWLAVLALALGVAGLAAGSTALVASRRRARV